MTDWLTDVRQELLAAVDSTLQLMALTAEDAHEGGSGRRPHETQPA